MERGLDFQSKERRRARNLKIGISAAAILLVVAHWVWPDFRLDTPASVLLVVAVVPWLGYVFESINTPFGGVKYREIERRLHALKAEAESTRQVTEANEARDLALGTQRDDPAEEELEMLAAEYNKVRSRMPRSSTARTQQMTRVVGRMMAVAGAGASLDIEAALRSNDPGTRLAAYSVLYTHPDFGYAGPLVESIVDVETQSFGQFWGLRALRRIVDGTHIRQLDAGTVRLLLDFKKRLAPDSDRNFELGGILQILGLAD